MALTLVIAFQCPRCQYAVDAATGIQPDGDPRDPQPGDITVCLACAAILEFRPDGIPRWLTLAEVSALDDDVRGRVVRTVVAIVCQRHPLIRHVRAGVPR